ncbi:tRNA (uracil(54)-C(5))-methyltransferase homolog [Corvus kubaryi]|uniref:tRNA (uracil(54)-C(5))-methyltransferase homolog n=1 Tax=Corvus kubaryi TaxID=68294 RepID=UPI001C03BFDA|nr:tRNA (uracil(54)-C(5))-methyltransferase homolog [Corvus kubaryi]
MRMRRRSDPPGGAICDAVLSAEESAVMRPDADSIEPGFGPAGRAGPAGSSASCCRGCCGPVQRLHASLWYRPQALVPLAVPAAASAFAPPLLEESASERIPTSYPPSLPRLHRSPGSDRCCCSSERRSKTPKVDLEERALSEGNNSCRRFFQMCTRKKNVGHTRREIHLLIQERNIVCVKANHVENILSKHKQVAQCYEEFICRSPLDSCILFHEGGHWRELVVRTTSCGHTMAIITFHPQELGQEALATQKALLKEFFMCGPGAVCALTSLYFQESTMTRCSHEQFPFQLLHGAPHIFEELLGLKFRISPDAFFQVNTAGAEVLYQAVGELCQATGDTVLLDICCGTGTIAFSLAHRVSKVIGVEVVEKAIEDAEWNAAFNGEISNCEFHSGKAEAVLPQLLGSWEDAQTLVAVVNPSRSGLHDRVVRAIQNCRSICRLLYISRKPEGEAMRNFLELCCPPDPRKKLAGEPFAPVLAVPFDMFPHTVYCELVLLFTC